MKIIFEILEDEQINIQMEGPVTVDNFIAAVFGGLESVTAQVPEEAQLDFYETLIALFDVFLSRSFPDIKPEGLNLSSAAILYAQDLIIAEASEKGISFEEAMEQLEERAQEYVRSLS